MIFACGEYMLPGATLKEKAQAAKEMGFEGIEVRGAVFMQDPGRAQEYLDVLGEAGLKLTSFCAGFEGRIVDIDVALRRKALEGILKLLDVGDKFGGVMLVAPPCYGPTLPPMPDMWPWKSRDEVREGILTEMLKQVAKGAAGKKSIFVLEPLNRYEQQMTHRVEQAVKVAKEVNSPNVKVMADFFHMAIEEADIAATLKEHGEWVYHIHLADSNRQLPGQGHTDFETSLKVLKKAKYKYALAYECSCTIAKDKLADGKKSLGMLKRAVS